MGYEINFKFYKKKAEGFGYDTEGEPEVMKVSVGKQWDEINLDDVAKTVFGQMAKRNILIVDAEIFEYTKKKVSFKMKDESISIKNRKFDFDITGAIKSEEDTVAPIPQYQPMPDLTQPVVQNGQVLQPHEVIRQSNAVVHQPQTFTQPVARAPEDISHLPPEVQAEILKMRSMQQAAPPNPADRMRERLPPAGQPIRYEIYDPHPDLLNLAKQRGLPFTLGKKYPIYSEKADPRHTNFGMIYITEDDQGNKRSLNDKHFVPIQRLAHDIADAPRPNYMGGRSQDLLESNQAVVNGKLISLPDIHTLGRRR